MTIAVIINDDNIKCIFVSTLSSVLKAFSLSSFTDNSQELTVDSNDAMTAVKVPQNISAYGECRKYPQITQPMNALEICPCMEGDPIIHLLKYNSRDVRLEVLYYPLLFLFNYNMALL